MDTVDPLPECHTAAGARHGTHGSVRKDRFGLASIVAHVLDSGPEYAARAGPEPRPRVRRTSGYGATGQLGAVANPLASVHTIRPWMSGDSGVLAVTQSATSLTMMFRVVARLKKFG